MSRKLNAKLRRVVMATNSEEWVSVSTYAKLIGKSTTHVYNLVKENRLKYKTFDRGRYKGILILNSDYE